MAKRSDPGDRRLTDAASNVSNWPEAGGGERQFRRSSVPAPAARRAQSRDQRGGDFPAALAAEVSRATAKLGDSLAPIGSPLPRRNWVRVGPQPKPCGLRLRLQLK